MNRCASGVFLAVVATLAGCARHDDPLPPWPPGASLPPDNDTSAPRPVGYGELRGPDEARRDVAGGRLRIQTFGFWSPDDPWVVFLDLLGRRYKIEIDLVAGCDIAPEDVARCEGYNAIQHAEIARRIGREGLEHLVDEAVAQVAAEGWPPQGDDTIRRAQRAHLGHDPDADPVAEVRQSFRAQVDGWWINAAAPVEE
jgi:hypothetical protein